MFDIGPCISDLGISISDIKRTKPKTLQKMKRILFFMMLGTFAVCTIAKTGTNPKSILDKTARVIKAGGDIEAGFKATSFADGKETGAMSGTLYLRDKQIHLVSDNVMYWFDGTNLWTYVKASNEVNISVPSLSDQQAMNPYLFLNLYKRGYDCKLTGTSSLRGKTCHVVKLTARQQSQKIQEILLDIDKTTYQPVCIRMRIGKNRWNRISILTCKTNQRFADKTFTFDKNEFPGLEVIDLR